MSSFNPLQEVKHFPTLLVPRAPVRYESAFLSTSVLYIIVGTVIPLLANALNIPYILFLGFIVLVPLMAFEVFVESAILRRAWKFSWDDLVRLTLRANIWSLIAGIPVKFLNAHVYESHLPKDLPGFFEAYPIWIAVGSAIYFSVTIAVETLYSWRFARTKELRVSPIRLIGGIVAANVATYAVLTPLHYHLTKPDVQISQLTRNAKWTKHPDTTLIYIDSTNSHLNAMNLNGSNARTVVPHPVRDYQLSENLGLCLYRSPEGNLYMYRAATAENIKVLETSVRFHMSDSAFSPSGTLVAFMPSEQKLLMIDTRTAKQSSISLPKIDGAWDPELAWSNEETTVYVAYSGTNGFLAVKIDSTLEMKVESTTNTNIKLLPVFGRIGSSIWGGGGDWGTSFSHEKCDDLTVLGLRGLGSELRVSRPEETVFRFRVKSGLLGLSAFNIGDVAFLPDCNELIFESKDHLYLLDLSAKRIGTITGGDRFILLSDRYKKRL